MSSEEAWKLCTQVFDNLLFFDLWCHDGESYDIADSNLIKSYLIGKICVSYIMGPLWDFKKGLKGLSKQQKGVCMSS